MIYNRATIGISATVVNALILAYILRGVVENLALMVWLFLIAVVTIIRLIIIIKFKQTPDKSKNISRSKHMLIIGVGTLGVLWGSTAIVLFPSGSVVHQAFIAFVLGGMVAGAVGVFSAIMPVFLSFSIPALTPVTIRFMLIGDEIHIAMGTMTALFGILTYFTAKHVGGSIRELVLLKETFANQLKERTVELMDANQKLKQEVEKHRITEKALEKERDTLQKTLSELKILKGFLPICSSCNKIRDDKGSWQRIEKYIQDRSEAKFSHGICPDCIKKIYPEYS